MITSAERQFGLPFDAAGPAMAVVFEGLTKRQVDDQILVDWLILSKAIRAVDHRIDRTHNNAERLAFGQNLANYLKEKTPQFTDENSLVSDRVTALKTVLDKLDATGRDKFCERGEKILGIIEQTRTEHNIEKFAELRRKEGEQAILLYVDLLPPAYRSLEGYEKFVSWLSHWLPVGTSLYTAWNLPARYENGEVLVKPTPQNRLTILSEAFPDLVAGVKVTNRKVLAGQIPFFFRFAGSMLHHKV